MTTSPPVVTFGDKKIPYSIVRVERETIGIIIEPSGEVIVRVPFGVDQNRIFEAVNKKRKWIVEKVNQTELVKKPVPKYREAVSGEKILYKNKLYRIKIHPQNKRRNRITFVGGIINIYIDEQLSEVEKTEKIRKQLVKWYKKKAEKFLIERVERYSKLIGKKPTSLQLRDTKLRWGSCTKNGKLILNWRIIMAPISAIDYVVIHELCHLKEPKHSTQFWQLIESIMPTYKKWKDWLFINGRLLELRM